MDKVFDYLVNEIKLRENSIIVVGCSGGPDSMALMYVLQEISKKQHFALICAHVNHNIRKESKQEEEFLKEYCNKNNITFESMTIEKYGDDNFHNEARKIRYQFFEDIINKYQANYLMTAHHGDDLIETILMRIVRGSTLKGYSGFEKRIDKKNYSLIRPLVFVTKEDILKFDKENDIPFVLDSSNFKGKYTRNRYRMEVLPFLKKEDPMVHEKFIKFSDTLIEYNNYINQELKRKINRIYHDDVIDINKFLKEEYLIQKKIIFYIFEEKYNDDLNQINMTHVLSIIKLMKSKRPNGSISLPNNYKAIKEYTTLKITQEAEYMNDYEIEITERVDLPNNHYIKVVQDENKNDNNVCRLLSNEISLPLYVRTRRLGDKMKLNKLNGNKKVKDIFIDAKVSKALRDEWPVVVDSQGNILWIPGIKKSKFSKQKYETYDIILKYN